MGAATKTKHTVLLWCDRGSANVNAPDQVVSMIAGDLVVAPEGAFVTGRGVVLPIRFPKLELGGSTRRIHLGAAWSDYMIFEYARSVLGEEGLTTRTAELFADRARPPALPQLRTARRVAMQLRANPADQTSLKEFAEREGVSARTLQRQFQRSTGYTFSEWRAAQRVAAAVELLGHNFTIAMVANLVGFHATSSLTRAFRRHTGSAPSAFTMAACGMGAQAEAPAIPATTMFARATSDLAMWIYRGTATVTTPGYCRFVTAGDTVTIPAGTKTRLDVSAGSVALPVPIAHANEGLTLHDALKHCLNGGMEPMGTVEKRLAAKQLQPTGQ